MGNNARVHVGRKQVIISPAIAEEGREREKERETKKKSYNPLSFFFRCYWGLNSGLHTC
jgi:hypothetical protein